MNGARASSSTAIAGRSSAARAPLGVTLPEVDVRRRRHGRRARSPAHPDEASGAAQVGYLEAAVAAARRGELAAIVTAPISKTWAKRARLRVPGHTEMLADAARRARRRDDVRRAQAQGRARDRARPARRGAARADDRRACARTIELRRGVARARLRHRAPRIGVVGLNPHAGEGGLLGDEDARRHRAGARGPVRRRRRSSGPLVPDAAFRDALHGRYDALVAMYHDQGLIPVKLVDFDEAVNVTLGLPIVRTSPDHGTAYDIAGKGIARAVSMQRALALAVEIATAAAR